MKPAEETELKLRLKLEHCRRTTNRHIDALRKLQADNANLRRELNAARSTLLAERIAKTHAEGLKTPANARHAPQTSYRPSGILSAFLRALRLPTQRRA